MAWACTDQRWPITRMPSKGGRNCAPVVQQVVEHGIEALFRRVPRLQQVMIQPDVVDGPDRGLGIRIGREQDALGGGKGLMACVRNSTPVIRGMR